MGEAESGDVWASHTQLRLSACSAEEKGDKVSERAVCLGWEERPSKNCA